MKEPEISLSLEDAAWRVPQRPRYRYYSTAPTSVSLRLADLAPQIPEAARLPGFDAQRTVELSCEEIFGGPIPKLSLSRLAELASEDVGTEGVTESSIRLPVARLALAFRFINGRELIEEPPPPKAERSLGDFAPKDEVTKAEPVATPLAGGASGAPEAPERLSPSEIPSGGAEVEETEPGEPESWRPIPLFPIFRRKVVEPQVKPLSPGAPVEPSDQPPQAETKTPSPAGNDSASHVREAVLVEAERSHSRRIEIVDQDALQAVFLTEEMLSVERVVELCGSLPGIKSCILAHGAAVLASYNVSESIDLVSLSAHALEMLAAMRQSAAQMGIGAVPAVTIHAEKGPITFFHQDDLCLLVMHKDRGFVPGVREKLQKVVEHLAQGDPALLAEDSRLPWTAKKAAT